MEALQVLQSIFYVVASVALLALIVFLVIGSWAIVRMRRAVEELTLRAGNAAFEAKDRIRAFMGSWMKFPIIAFILRKILRKLL